MQDTAKKQFYRSFFAIVVPIAVQQLITAAVGVADTLMLGYVSQTALAASSLAGQIQFLLNMIYGGLAAGITILAAQYWGRQVSVMRQFCTRPSVTCQNGYRK